MSNLSRPSFAGSYFKGAPRILEADKDAKAEAKHKRQVYAKVDKRDGRKCRCCARVGDPNATDALGKIHRAHIHDAGTQGPMTPANLCSLCWLCAGLETVKQLFIIGVDANKKLKFEILGTVVQQIFGTNPLPPHVKLIKVSRRQRYGA